MSANVIKPVSEACSPQIQLDLNGAKVNYPGKNIQIFQHKDKGFYLPLIYNKADLSLSRLKKRVLNSNQVWTHFITLTFSEKELVYQKGKRILSNQYDDKGGKLTAFMYYPKYYSYKTINFDEIDGKWLRRWKDNIKRDFRRHGLEFKFTHFWKYEEGKKNNHPHFHFVVNSNMCTVCLHFLLERHFPCGFVDVQKITSPKFLQMYLNKYFSKNQKFKYFTSGRRWGSSRDVKFIKQESDYDMVSITKDSLVALEFLESWGTEMCEHYCNTFLYNKLWFSLVQNYCENYNIQLNEFVVHRNENVLNRAQIFKEQMELKKKSRELDYWEHSVEWQKKHKIE